MSQWMEMNLNKAHLLVQVADPLCKLLGVGNGSRQKHIVYIVGKKNDGLLPNHTTLWNRKEVGDLRLGTLMTEKSSNVS